MVLNTFLYHVHFILIVVKFVNFSETEDQIKSVDIYHILTFVSGWLNTILYKEPEIMHKSDFQHQLSKNFYKMSDIVKN